VKVLIVVNVDWYFWSHRLPLARALRQAGYDVVVVTGEEGGFRARIEAEGFRFVPIRLRRGSTRPFSEIRTFLDLLRIYRQERPAVVHHVTIKPIVYGSIAARFAGRPAIINAVAGLGYTFLPSVRRSLLGKLTLRLYRAACSGARTLVLCQNPEDQRALIDLGIVPSERTALIRGSGVDVTKFAATRPPENVPIVLLSGRMLWDKGVREFVDAARILRERGVAHRAVIAGILDSENPNGVPGDELQRWHDEGAIEWWGQRSDMPFVLSQASIVTLPSYYPEGVPKSLIEAAACGRAIVATDVPGCREIARHGVNADLVPPRDPLRLADAIAALLADGARRAAYGEAGHRIASEEFSEERVLSETLALYRRWAPQHEAASA
jgi:glycosyltransferase involved in cell wall biosynthesis